MNPSDERLEQDPFDPVVAQIITDLRGELNKFSSKDPNSAIYKWFAAQGINDLKKYPMTENESVIAGAAQTSKKVSGPSIALYKDDTVYIGNLKELQRSGFGYRTYPKTDLVYAGEYLSDMKHGVGRIYSMKRKVWGFKGQHANDKKNGHGRWEKADGNIYTGNFLNDKLSGYGVMSWANGDHYQGEFQNDFKNGNGKMFWMNGDVYEGQFKDNTMNGSGRYTWKNGEFFEGEFKNGIMFGQGTMDYTSAIGIRGSGADVQSIRNLKFDIVDFEVGKVSQVGRG